MTVTTVFADTTDGLMECNSTVYATAASGTGNLTQFLNDTTQTFAGQYFSGGSYRCLEGGFAFNTAAIPDGDIVGIVAFTLRSSGFQLSVGTTFDIEVYAYDWGTSLSANPDFRPSTWLQSATKLASRTIEAVSGSWDFNGFYTLTSTAAFGPAINKTGTTRLITASSRHRTATPPTALEYAACYMAEASGTTSDPTLVLTHFPPVDLAGAVSLTTTAATDMNPDGVPLVPDTLTLVTTTSADLTVSEQPLLGSVSLSTGASGDMTPTQFLGGAASLTTTSTGALDHTDPMTVGEKQGPDLVIRAAAQLHVVFDTPDYPQDITGRPAAFLRRVVENYPRPDLDETGRPE